MEMLIVVALLGLLVGITFPSVTAGIESIRLASAADAVASYLNAAVNRAERWQEPVEIEILLGQRRMNLRSASPGFERSLELPTGVDFKSVRPEIRDAPDLPRRFLVYPGGTVPRIAVELVNSRGGGRIVSVDPMTGAPRIVRPGQENQP
jgi:hypothetical protein